MSSISRERDLNTASPYDHLMANSILTQVHPRCLYTHAVSNHHTCFGVHDDCVGLSGNKGKRHDLNRTLLSTLLACWASFSGLGASGALSASLATTLGASFALEAAWEAALGACGVATGGAA